MKNNDQLCPCGSGLKADNCCSLLISGKVKAQSAEQLMRSRYVAYVNRDMAYILRSWHSSTRPAELDAGSNLSWTGLHVLDASDFAAVDNTRMQEKDSDGVQAQAQVEFVASFVNHGEPGCMRERSRFLIEQGEWRYVDGVQIDVDQPVIDKRPGRNDPCYCGSGKKFKKCCLGK